VSATSLAALRVPLLDHFDDDAIPSLVAPRERSPRSWLGFARPTPRGDPDLQIQRPRTVASRSY
jgi:hypothetical protein